MSKLPEPNDSLSRRLREYDERLRRLEASRSPFFGTGLSPDGAGGLDLQGVPLNPFIPDIAEGFGSAFSLTTSFVAQASDVLTVPVGCSRAMIQSSAWVFATNPNTTGGVDGTGTDALWCDIKVTANATSTYSESHGQGISGSGGFTTATSGLALLLSNLAEGDTVTVEARVAVSMQAFAADANNTATLSGSVFWLR